MRTRETERIEKIWNSFQSWNGMEDEESQNQAEVAKIKIINLCTKFGGCDNFGQWSEKDESCKNCEGILQTCCSYLRQEDLDAKEAEEKENRKTRTSNDDLLNCVRFVMKNHDLMTRKAMVAELSKDSARSEGGWKTMVGAVCLALSHLNQPGAGAYGWAAHGILNENIRSFTELKKYVAKQEDKTPGVVGRSVQYVWATWQNL